MFIFLSPWMIDGRSNCITTADRNGPTLRHSNVNLTIATYTDERLLDSLGAVEM